MKLYRHYKNKFYRFIDIAKHSETLEDVVIYEALYKNSEGQLWVRPKKMFFENVAKGPRFAKVALKIRTFEKIGSKEKLLIFPLLKEIFKPFDSKAFDAAIKSREKILLVVGYVDGKVAGFKVGFQHDGEKFYSAWGGVDPKYRDLGIAQELMRAQHEWCRKNKFKVVQTRTKNKWRQMIILNLKNGFHIIGSYTDEHREPKLILEKKL